VGVPDRHELRVGDSERQAVVDQLRTHLGAGRLTLDEFEERTGVALAARTVAELQMVTVDLPAIRTAPKGPPVRVREPAPRSSWDKALRIHTGLWWLSTAFLLLIALTVDSTMAWVVVVSAVIGFTVGVHAVVKRAVDR
jgi:Domain of unknown function (DUF1707)